MAAVLCKAPCALCKGLTDCISESCACICKPLCSGLSRACSSPFCLHVTVATVLNIPPLAIALSTGIPAALSGGLDCTGVLWLLVQIAFVISHIAAAWYVAMRVSRDDAANEDEGLRRHRTAAGRAMHVMCYDPFMALYILVGLGSMVWLVMGSSWTASGTIDNDKDCPDNVTSAVATAISFGWMFVFVGGTAFLCSLCCTGCDRRDYGDMPVWVPEGGGDGDGEATTAARPQQQKVAKMKTSQKQGTDGTGTATTAENIPVAVAVAVAVPEEEQGYSVTTGTASSSMSKTSSPTVLRESRARSAPSAAASSPYSNASAPPAEAATSTSRTPEEEEAELKAAESGAAVGRKVGQLFKVGDTTQTNLERTGAKASMAINSGMSAAMKFVGGSSAKGGEGGRGEQEKTS